MNDNTPNEFASYGLEILKRSVLLVLYEQHTFGPPHRRFMTLKEVGERLDIRPIGRYTNMNGLTHGILLHLLDDRDAEWLGKAGRWQITKKGVSVIEG